ncbi:MAG: hypothetical protein E6F99_08405 [Actinobacteria bacterium]|nr:MAG: hypothetical protein E6F99_08405 [Actinomycetota bacterium]
MSEDLAAAAQRVFEMFGAVAADPDNAETGRAADEALYQLEALLPVADGAAAGGAGTGAPVN